MNESKAGQEQNSSTPDGAAGSAEPVEPAKTPTPKPSESQTVTESIGGSMVGALQDRRLGEFRLLRLLGRGGMAEVYLAEQTSLNRQVALKVLRPELLSDEAHVKRFEREAKAAGGLNHPNIVQVYMIGEEQGILYIAQEYVRGLNLGQFLKRKGPPKLSVALHFMRQVASALAAAGEAGIVHRDVKPENILITGKGDVKVADFGLAQLAQAGDGLNLTQVGMTMGTPLYMSPEQVGGKKLDQRSDVYSFGVTCYYMLCGHPPFHGETALSVAFQHVNEEPQPLAERRPDLPPALCQITEKMMAKDPDDRYPDAQTLLKDLRSFSQAIQENPDAAAELSLEEFAAESDAPLNGSTARSGRFFHWSAKKHLLAALFSSLLVGSAAAGFGWWLHPGNPLETPIKAGQKKVPEQETAAQQYLRAALLVDDEDAWLAVVEYFPGDRRYRRRAQTQLASLYLRTRRFDEAEAIYQEFTRLGEEGVTFKAIGHAGLAFIASLNGKHSDSQHILVDDLLPIREHLDDAEMSRVVRETIRRNRAKLGERVKQGFEDLFQLETEPDELE